MLHAFYEVRNSEKWGSFFCRITLLIQKKKFEPTLPLSIKRYCLPTMYLFRSFARS